MKKNSPERFETSTERRLVYIECAYDAIQKSTAPGDIKMAFKVAGLYPCNPNIVLVKPCVTELDVIATRKRARTNVAINKQLLVDVSEIPDRRKQTLATRAVKKAAKKAAESAITEQDVIEGEFIRSLVERDDTGPEDPEEEDKDNEDMEDDVEEQQRLDEFAMRRAALRSLPETRDRERHPPKIYA